MPSRHVPALVTLLGILLLLSGCKINPAPRVVARYGESWDVRTRRAGYDGRYDLYVSQGRKGALGTSPLLSRTLRRGQTYGFMWDGANSLVAVAGDEQVVLDPRKTYAWTMRAEAGQIDRRRTTLIVAAVVAAGALIAASMAAAGAAAFSAGI